MFRLKNVSANIYIYLLFCLSAGLLLGGCNSFQAAPVENNRTYVSILAPLHFPQQPSPDVVAELEKLTNSELDIRWVPEGVYTDKMNTALTTNSLAKVTFVKFSDYNLVKNAIKSGEFWPISSYLAEFPNLSGLNPSILKQTAVGGEIYGLYTERPSSRQGIIIRQDWLDNLQLERPGTIEELYEVMRQFTYNDPDQNGKHDTIGIVDRNDLVYGVFKTLSSYFGTPNNWKVEDGQFIPEFETEEYMNTMNFMKKLYDEKIINQDFPLTSKDQQRDSFIRGKAGIYIGSMTDAQRLYIEAKVLDSRVKFSLINRIEGPAGYKVWSIPNYNGLFLFSKKAIATEEELKEILAFFDRTMDTDVANFMMYGIEGRHYKLVDGKVILPEETSKLRVDEINPLYSLMIANISNPNIFEVDQKEELTALADQLSEDNQLFLVEDPTVYLQSETYDEKNVELSQIIVNATYNYILGHITADEFKAEIEYWKQSGGALVIEEYNKAFAAH